MKYNYLFMLLLCMTCFTGCKDKNPSEETANQSSLAGPLKVTLNVIAEKNDSFCVLYTEDNTINFGSLGVWQEVKGSPNVQPIDFFFAEDASPTSLRLDLGLNSEQAEVTLKSVVLEKGNNRREISGAELGMFFRADENHCTFDIATGKVTPLVVDGKRRNPCLYPGQELLMQELEKIMQ